MYSASAMYRELIFATVPPVTANVIVFVPSTKSNVFVEPPTIATTELVAFLDRVSPFITLVSLTVKS